MVTRKYNQRTKGWDSKIIKKEKDYGYVYNMMAEVFRMREADQGKITRPVMLRQDDPRLISPTIAPTEPESSLELFRKRTTRF